VSYGKYVHKASDIPEGEHYAIITFGSVCVAGYDPGDPPSYETTVEYQVYPDRAAWEKEVERLTKGKSSEFRAIHVRPASIKVNVEVSVS
jgi:hypothetical protein